jgi:Ion channel
MLLDLLFGITINLAVMAVHVGATLVVMEISDVIIPSSRTSSSRRRHLVLMIVVVVCMLLAHLCEVGVWSVVYLAMGIVPNAEDAYYSAFTTYTTLGLGHSVEREYARLLEPMTATSGILMFGWTTAVLIAAVQRGAKRFL